MEFVNNTSTRLIFGVLHSECVLHTFQYGAASDYIAIYVAGISPHTN